MAVRFGVLISLLGIFWLGFAVKGPEARGGNLCLACHPQHYASIGDCALCHRGDQRSERAAVAHRDLIPASMAGFAVPGDRKTQYGLRLLDRLACRRCHVWDGRGNRLASDLDQVSFSSPVTELISALRSPVAQMPDYVLDSDQIEAAVAALLKTSRSRGPAEKQAPVKIHFAEEREEGQHPFEIRCGGCHRMLSTSFGALGSGDVAPNLSGLFGEHYPAATDGGRWTESRLEKWLANPRALQATVIMQPVPLAAAERERILEVFRGSLDINRSRSVRHALPEPGIASNSSM